MDLMVQISDAMRPTVGDLLFTGQRQRTRILNRTARGVDVNEVAFRAYSEKGPYYFYPGKSSKNRAGARNSFVRKIGGNVKALKRVNQAFAHVHSGNRLGISGLTGLGVKYVSYGAFKRFLGRTGVDLRGPSAPHMLQAMIVRVNNVTLTQGDTGHGEGNLTPASEIRIGIYGEEALRASGHQTGAKHLPRRKFMGANEEDQRLMLQDIIDRMLFRAKKVFKK